MSLSEAAWGNGRSAVRANRGTQQSFFKEEAESAIYICNGTAGAMETTPTNNELARSALLPQSQPP